MEGFFDSTRYLVGTNCKPTSLPADGWIHPCRLCGAYTAGQSTISCTQGVPLCGRCREGYEKVRRGEFLRPVEEGLDAVSSWGLRGVPTRIKGLTRVNREIYCDRIVASSDDYFISLGHVFVHNN